MPYKATSQKTGQDYYLYAMSSPNGQAALYYFLPLLKPGTLNAIPDGYVVAENPETGTPILAKDSYAAKLLESTSETEKRRVANEARLGVSIPRELQAIENVALEDYGEHAPFQDTCRWLNAACDWFLPIEEWELASENNWFDCFREDEIGLMEQAGNDVPGDLHLLVIIAQHSESQLCFDYRKCGPTGMPKVSYIDVTDEPLKSTTVCESASEFVAAVLRSPHSKLGH